MQMQQPKRFIQTTFSKQAIEFKECWKNLGVVSAS
jgi:hypothetical protein